MGGILLANIQSGAPASLGDTLSVTAPKFGRHGTLTLLRAAPLQTKDQREHRSAERSFGEEESKFLPVTRQQFPFRTVSFWALIRGK
jgi:hypothetical protein